MANVNSPFGLRPVRYKNGSPYNGASRRYYTASAGADWFLGDMMVIAGSADAAGVATVTKATLAVTNQAIGPIVAVEPITSASTVYVESGTARYIYIADDPNLIFEVQCETANNLAATSIGLNAILVETHSGSTVTGLSGQELDTGIGTAPATTNTMMLHIMGMRRSPDNDPFTAHGIAEVIIAMHMFNAVGDATGILGV